jgi:trigger factor
VSRDELTRAVMEQAQQFPGQEKAVFDYYRKNPGKLDELRGPILEEKAVDWILAQVQMKDRSVTTKELAESGYEDAGPVDKSEKSEKKATPKKKSSKK